MKKDDIKTLIVVLMICLICTILVLLVGIKSNFEKLKGLTEYNTYFSVVNSINEYINYIGENNAEAVYALLDEDYINKNEIEEFNVLNYVSDFSSNDSFKVTKMAGADVSKNYYLYFAEGQIIQNTYDGINIIDDDYKILIISDYSNVTKAIYPITKNDNIKRTINSIKKRNIEKNEYNAINGVGIIKSEQICSLYLSDYVNYLFNDIDKAYDLTDKKMKDYYSTVDSFGKLINEKKNTIVFTADKCHVSNDYRGRVYSIIDTNSNRYYFKEKSIMDYSVVIEFYDPNTTKYTTDPESSNKEDNLDIFDGIEKEDEESD